MDIQTLEDERRRAIQQQGDLRMGVSGGWNVAGKNMRSSPYADFEPFDDGYDDPEDYRGKPVFGVEEDGQMFFDFPFVQAPNDMMIATHDKPLFKTPPATGAGADNMAPDWLIDYMNRKDENLLQLQDRLKRVEAQTNNMMIAGTPTAADVLMPTDKGYYLPLEDGIYGHVLQNEGGYLKEGKMYDQGIHGLPVPLV